MVIKNAPSKGALPRSRRAMPGRPAFSVVVTARNEEQTLPRLLESLAEFRAAGGEILLADTGSDDRTLRVARRAGCRIETLGSRFHSLLTPAQARKINATFARGGERPLVRAGERLFDFGRARAFAGGLASNDFVWHVDASDVVLAADLAFLDAAVRSGRVTSFEYVLRLGWTSFRVVRFFDRRVHEWRGRVHEAPYATSEQPPAARIACSEDQLSLRHVRNEATNRAHYLAGLALDVLDFPKIQRWRHYLGRELCYLQKHRSAIPVLRAHASAREGWAPEQGESYILMGTSYEALGRPREAAECYFRASRADPARRQALLKLASLCQSGGDFQGSVAFAAAALTIPRTSAFADADENYTHDPHALLYWGLFWLGRRDEARTHWQLCRQMAPDNPKFLEDARLFAQREQTSLA